jgi:hypothetical protein
VQGMVVVKDARKRACAVYAEKRMRRSEAQRTGHRKDEIGRGISKRCFAHAAHCRNAWSESR